MPLPRRCRGPVMSICNDGMHASTHCRRGRRPSREWDDLDDLRGPLAGKPSGSPRQESNLYPTLRRRVHYPLCYEEQGPYCSRCLPIAPIEYSRQGADEHHSGAVSGDPASVLPIYRNR
ncbi:hypothetical protein ACCAA_770011 [Candidatus Accumulibacter aalborgensis]|uniref:Uncharacterized protein n=1 Tax=Candidatus Accumulibacter aalborgensis TaxID=1860102 RepID=A0A1A8XXU3_9PROT|nr:hypothetical protein ACCAA_770011 [Candidatus Accumulibacter aalborgensis]